MSEFYTQAAFLDFTELCKKYSLIVSTIENECKNINNSINSLKRYTGFGIETQISNLEKCRNQLDEWQNDLMLECGALKNIIEIITQKENKAVSILGGKVNNEIKDYGFSKEETLIITHEDWGKLVNQFKYYSTRNDATRRFFEWLQNFYNLDKDIKLTREEYDLWKNTFNMLIHKDDRAAYVYHDVQYGSIEGKDSSKDYLAKVEGDVSGMTAVAAYGCDGDTAEYTLKIGSVGGEVSGGLELASLSEDEMKDLQKAISKAKTNEEAKIALAEFGIKIKGEVKGITLDVVSTRKINDSMSIYNKMTYTIGEAYANANILHGEMNSNNTSEFSVLEVGAGASVAKIESTWGIKTNDGTYAIKGGLNAGIEWKLKFGSESEIQAAIASLGLEFDGGFDYYIWK